MIRIRMFLDPHQNPWKAWTYIISNFRIFVFKIYDIKHCIKKYPLSVLDGVGTFIWYI